MRIQHWLTVMSVAVCALTTPAALAQVTSSPSSVQPASGTVHLDTLTPPVHHAGDPSAVPHSGPAPAFAPPYGNHNPAVMYPPAAPSTAQPWPQVSPYQPFNVMTDQHVNQAGLWYRDVVHRDRRYFTDVEAMIVDYRRAPNNRIGTDNLVDLEVVTFGLEGFQLPTFDRGLPPTVNANTNVAIFGGTPLSTIAVDNGVLPYPVQIIGPTAVLALPDTSVYPIRTMGQLYDDDFDAAGVRGRWGWTEGDGSGFQISAWYGGESDNTFRLGQTEVNGVPVTQELILDNIATSFFTNPNFTLLFTRIGAVPYDSGLSYPEFGTPFVNPNTGNLVTFLEDFDDSGFRIGTQKYDLLYQVDYSIESAGAGISLYHAPIYKSKAMRLRGVWGARYVHLEEDFRFRGVDSGFNYIPDESVVGLGTFRPAAIVLAPVHPILDSRLNANTRADMAGPEIGLRYDFGDDDGFKIWGESLFSLLANHERIRLGGENIGTPVELMTLGIDFFSEDTRFTREEDHTHVSPMFTQTLRAETHLFRYIPLLKRLHVLDEAKFRFGVDISIIGGVSRAGENIEWNGFPRFPEITNDRSTFVMHDWNLGIHWNY